MRNLEINIQDSEFYPHLNEKHYYCWFIYEDLEYNVILKKEHFELPLSNLLNLTTCEVAN